MFAAVALALSPLVVLALASLLGPGQYQLPPSPPSAEGYAEVLSLGMARALLNSTIVAVVSTAIALAVSVPTAYSVARLGFKPRFFIAVLAAVALTRSIPPSTLLTAVYQILWSVGLVNSLLGLSLALQIYLVPMALWILIAFAADLSPELDAAARIDGAGPARRLIHIAIPAMRNAIAAVAALSVIETWGEYLYASVILNSQSLLTASVVVGQLVTSEFGFDWNVLAAASLLMTLPLLLLVGLAANAMSKLTPSSRR